MVKSKKSKGKKISRNEIEGVFNIIQDLLISSSNNRMRIDTLEGKIDLKIDHSITKLRKESVYALKELEKQTTNAQKKLDLRLDEFQRLNFRLNKSILDKPYKYTDETKEDVMKSLKDQEHAFNRKYDTLLSRIVAIKRFQQEMANSGNQIFNSEISENALKDEIKREFENSKVAILQEEHENLKNNFETQISTVAQKLADFGNIIDEFKDNVECQVYEFKSHTKHEVNNKLKEFQSLNRELKRHQDLYRKILGSNYFNSDDTAHKSIIIPSVDGSRSPSKMSLKDKFRSHSLSEAKNKNTLKTKRVN